MNTITKQDPKQQFRAELDEMIEAFVEEIRNITGDNEWLGDEWWLAIDEEVADIPYTIMCGYSIDYETYNAKAIHPKLDSGLLEQAVKNALERIERN